MILYNPDDVQALVTDNHWVPSVHIELHRRSHHQGLHRRIGDPVAQINGGVYTPSQGAVMADFSSRGSNSVAEDIIKPDVTAPGVNILAGNTPARLASRRRRVAHLVSCSSRSAVRRCRARTWQVCSHCSSRRIRYWSPAAAKSALMTTSYQDVTKEDGVTPADPFDMGAGHVDPSGAAAAPGSIFNPGLVYDAGFNDYLGFLCDAAPEIFSDPDSHVCLARRGWYPDGCQRPEPGVDRSGRAGRHPDRDPHGHQRDTPAVPSGSSDDRCARGLRVRGLPNVTGCCTAGETATLRGDDHCHRLAQSSVSGPSVSLTWTASRPYGRTRRSQSAPSCSTLLPA